MRFPITLLKEVGALITPQHKAILAIKAGHFIIKTIKNRRKKSVEMPEIEQYEHHGNKVWVRSDLKGKHREHCLCFSCQKFSPNNDLTNCLKARRIFKTCVDFGLVTPVWECPDYFPIYD